MIAIVDYGMGNLRSVEKGFLKVGVEARVVTDARGIRDAGAVVLPGVGAFADCMCNLSEMRLIDEIYRAIEAGKPFMGICLGLQVLFKESGEFGSTEGLGIFGGRVVRFPEGGLKVPHMGWNSIRIERETPLLKGIEDGSQVYFVHSYYVVPEDEGIIAATTDYGVRFTSMVQRDNVVAMQFHPEKSQRLGLRILKNFGDFAARS